MAATARVSGATVSTVAAATSRIGSGGRNIASVSTPRVDAMSFTASTGPHDDSVHYNDESHDDFGGGQHHEQHQPAEFVFVLNRVANAYKITEYVAANDSTAPRLLISDMVYGVGIYETNMRAIAGNARMIGTNFSFFF